MQITFDSVSLTTSPYNIKEIDHEKTAPLENYVYNLSRQRGSIYIGRNYRPKEIKMSGTITGTDESNLDANVDALKMLVENGYKNLDIEYRGSTRRYRALVVEADIPRNYFHMTFVPFSITFLVPTGVGEDITATTENYTAVTTTPYNNDIEIAGNTAPLPEITIEINTGTGITQAEFLLNGDKLTVTQALVATDILVLDCENKKVTLNGDEIDYTGIFPDFTVGDNNFEITMTGSARNYDLSISYKKLYL